MTINRKSFTREEIETLKAFEREQNKSLDNIKLKKLEMERIYRETIEGRKENE